MWEGNLAVVVVHLWIAYFFSLYVYLGSVTKLLTVLLTILFITFLLMCGFNDLVPDDRRASLYILTKLFGDVSKLHHPYREVTLEQIYKIIYTAI